MSTKQPSEKSREKRIRIRFDGKELWGRLGDNLRQVLLRQRVSPHNHAAYLSCQGIGSCGTCAVEVLQGDAGPVTMMERWRLHFPPHTAGPKPMRLACQIKLKEPLELRKWPGFWGPLQSAEAEKKWDK